MYQVYVNSYRLVHVTHGKPYYIYNVDVINRLTGDSHQIHKRYSEFNALHRMVIVLYYTYLSTLHVYTYYVIVHHYS